jgi:hypothetical protein
MIRTVLTCALLLIPSLAFADKKAADSCAAGLAPDAQKIYVAAAPGFVAAANPQAEVKGQVQALVLGGKIDRGSARDNAMAAGDCLKKLR